MIRSCPLPPFLLCKSRNSLNGGLHSILRVTLKYASNYEIFESIPPQESPLRVKHRFKDPYCTNAIRKESLRLTHTFLLIKGGTVCCTMMAAQQYSQAMSDVAASVCRWAAEIICLKSTGTDHSPTHHELKVSRRHRRPTVLRSALDRDPRWQWSSFSRSSTAVAQHRTRAVASAATDVAIRPSAKKTTRR